MPLARLEIEQIEGNRWVAEVEAGGFVGQRNFEHRRLHATSYADIMAKVAEFYYRQVPPAMPEPEATSAHDQDEDAQTEEDPDPRDPRDNERIELRREAEALGIDIDLRWGAKRLQDEITKAKAGETVVE